MAVKRATGLAKKANQDIANIQAQLAAEAEQINENIGKPQGNAISLKGKVFTFPGGESTSEPIEVVVVEFIAANKYYESSYDPKNPAPPVCWAINKIFSALAPSDKVLPENKQTEDDCAMCPNNQWNSNGDGKLCKNSYILAVLPTDATSEDSVMTLSVPPTAIKGWEGYVKRVSRLFNTPPIGVVTTVAFSQTDDYPKPVFGAPEPNENVAHFMQRRAEAMELLLVEPTPVTEEAPKKAARKKAARKKAVRRA